VHDLELLSRIGKEDFRGEGKSLIEVSYQRHLVFNQPLDHAEDIQPKQCTEVRQRTDQLEEAEKVGVAPAAKRERVPSFFRC